MFKVVKTGKKTAKKGILAYFPNQVATIAHETLGWKRMITKPTFVGPDFTRRPVKYERHDSKNSLVVFTLTLDQIYPAYGIEIQESEYHT